jgi:hypothetical protein
VKPSAPALAALAALCLPAPALLALHFRDGPPARVTGGFGEDSCEACHFGNSLNDSAGKLTLSGLPEQFERGATYALELTLTRPGIKAGGFQVAIRNADNQSQAGRIVVPSDEEARVAILEERGVQFAQHRLAEAPAEGGDSLRWKLSWTSPDAGGPVTVHVAAVAGDGDESQAGDYAYAVEVATAASNEEQRPAR